ncbi:MAG TPA: VWA domain-containing protein [Pseudogracilibacillus sp.]|nr:VWA domain-containing protein [Pseudogracilibacillus sp.]
MEVGTLRQVLLITDGESNSGECPVKTAARLFKMGIVVNVIGIVNEVEATGNSYDEINEIAEAGGGVSQIVYEEDLSQTVQAVTVQAMSQTIQGVVNKELTQIFGVERKIEDIAPEQRGEVVELVEDMGETAHLQVLILVDTSASMQHKLATVKEALLDLSYNLQARAGANEFAIYQYPHKNEVIAPITEWTRELQSMSVIFPKLLLGGMTPTGPALNEALHLFSQKQLKGYDRREYGSEEA